MKTIISIILLALALPSHALLITTEHWDDYVLVFRVSSLNTPGDDYGSASFTDDVLQQYYSVTVDRTGTDLAFDVFWNPPGTGQNVDDQFTWTYPVTSEPSGFSGTGAQDRNWQEGGSVLITYHNVFPSDGIGGSTSVPDGGSGIVAICVALASFTYAFSSSGKRQKTSIPL